MVLAKEKHVEPCFLKFPESEAEGALRKDGDEVRSDNTEDLRKLILGVFFTLIERRFPCMVGSIISIKG